MVDPDAEIIFGTAINKSLGDEVNITVIATGFSNEIYRPREQIVTENWTSHTFDDIGLDAEDVDLPAFLRRRRVTAQ